MRKALVLLAAAGAVAAARPAAAQDQPAAPRAPTRAERQHHDEPTDARLTVRTIAILQEEFKHHHQRYAANLRELGFTPHRGIEVSFPTATATGFAVVARHRRRECAVYRGDAPPPRRYTTQLSAVVCTPPANGSAD
jgi:hypothetical protein